MRVNAHSLQYNNLSPSRDTDYREEDKIIRHYDLGWLTFSVVSDISDTDWVDSGAYN